jgi:hypothetical protein
MTDHCSLLTAPRPPFRCYILEVARVRGRFSDQLALLQDINRRWRPRVVGIETVAYQEVLAQAAADHGLVVAELKGQRLKAGRIENLSVAASRGALFLPAGQRWVREFCDEAWAWPLAGHDDQLDALAWALRLGLQRLEQQRRRGPLEVLSGLSGGAASGAAPAAWGSPSSTGRDEEDAADIAWPGHPARSRGAKPRAA